MPSGAPASIGTSAEKVPNSVSGMLRDQISLPRESVTETSALVPFAGRGHHPEPPVAEHALDVDGVARPVDAALGDGEAHRLRPLPVPGALDAEGPGPEAARPVRQGDAGVAVERRGDQREGRPSVLVPPSASGALAGPDDGGQPGNARQAVGVRLALPLHRAVAVVERQRRARDDRAVGHPGDPDDARRRPELGVHGEVGDLPGDALGPLPAPLRVDLRRGGDQVEEPGALAGERARAPSPAGCPGGCACPSSASRW